MTTLQRLIAKLDDQRRGIDIALDLLRQEVAAEHPREKAKQITRSLKPLHWTQRPENAAKVKRFVRKMRLAHKARAAKAKSHA